MEKKEYKGIPVTIADHFEISALADRVVSLGTYTELDEDRAQNIIAGRELTQTGCTACCKVVDNGDLIVGRNMDLSISECPVYLFKTSYGKYKTMNIMYLFHGFPTYEEVMKNGLSDDVKTIIPYLCSDMLNEKGLYMEANMRPNEHDSNGVSLFRSTGTNPGKKTVYLGSLSQYLGTRCATIEEMLKEIENLNIYNESKYLDWPLGFLVADATGRHGVLEVINNEVIFTDGADMQANYFVNEKYLAMEQGPQGFGRTDVLKEGLPAVQDELDMHHLMSKIYYSYLFRDYLISNPYLHCDFRSDFSLSFPVNEKGEIDMEHGDPLRSTTEWMLDPKNEAGITEAVKAQAKVYWSMSEAQRRATCEYWYSTIHNIVNVNKRTMTVQLWEDPYLTFSMEL